MPQQRMGFHKSGLPSQVNFPLTMAPMVGLSHCAFRQLIREYLPAEAVTLWPSEMLNSRRIPNEELASIPEAMTMGDENFWMPQILANDDEKIRLSLKKLHDHGAQGVDINMGCPVRRALKHNYGVSLMGDAGYAADVVGMAVRHAQGPVSVKLRAVEAGQKENWLGFVKGLEDAGASWLCLHPRTADQKRRGRADWTQIKELTDQVSLPVIGNGDIQTVYDILKMLTETRCDMVMVGRVLTARPWLFWQLGECLGWKNPPGRRGRAPSSPLEEGIEYGKSLLRLLQLMAAVFPEKLALRKFVFHVKTGAVWLPFGHDLYSRVTGCRTLAEAKACVEIMFSRDHHMSKTTELRQ